MAIGTFSELKTAIATWARRTTDADYVTRTADFISLAEARLNRELGPVETDATLTGSVGSRALDISALSMVEPIALWITEASGGNERELQPQYAGQMPYRSGNGLPAMWTVDNQASIDLDCPCDVAYAFRFRYRQRFALSDSATTNWLLTQHPDIYLAASMMWGGGYKEDMANAAMWNMILDRDLKDVKHTLGKAKRGTLRIDPAMQRRRSYNIFRDGP